MYFVKDRAQFNRYVCTNTHSVVCLLPFEPMLARNDTPLRTTRIQREECVARGKNMSPEGRMCLQREQYVSSGKKTCPEGKMCLQW